MVKIGYSMLNSFMQLEEYKNLTKLQKKFFKEFFSGRNIFLTGPAGTGKSFAVNLLFKFLDLQGIFYGKTATTGVAALNIGGTTVHSWSGMGLADDHGMDLLDKVSGNKKAVNRIKAAKVLIIDEISMAKSELLDKLDIVCQYIRNKERPFGGIQVVFVGDFMQLPPVFKAHEKEQFAFESQAWADAKVKTIHLTEIVRQHDEPHFAHFLNQVRLGKASDFSLLMSCIDRKFPDDGIKPVKLYCKNIDVSRYNHEELRKIKSDSRFYEAIDTGGDQWVQFFEKNCPAPTKLELRVGAQVILLVNLDVAEGLVNGSVGRVTNLYENSVEVEFASGTQVLEMYKWEIKQNEFDTYSGTMKKVTLASRSQIPLKLAWALTIHKSQGATLDRAEVDVSEAFAAGQVYVALSRVRNLGSLKILSFSPHKIQTNKKCLDFYNLQEEEKEVEFLLEDDD